MILEPDALADLVAEAREDFDHRNRTSRPTPQAGAPDLGLGWSDPETRPAAWRAFGEA